MEIWRCVALVLPHRWVLHAMQRILEAEEEARPSVYSVSLTWCLQQGRWLNHALLSDELELDIDEGTKVGLTLSTHDGLELTASPITG